MNNNNETCYGWSNYETLLFWTCYGKSINTFGDLNTIKEEVLTKILCSDEPTFFVDALLLAFGKVNWQELEEHVVSKIKNTT